MFGPPGDPGVSELVAGTCNQRYLHARIPMLSGPLTAAGDPMIYLADPAEWPRDNRDTIPDKS